MDPKDIIILVVIGAGVLALKSFFDALNINIPPWALYVFVFALALVSVIGVLALAYKQLTAKHRISIGGLFFSILALKHAAREASRFWLNWPGWLMLLFLGKTFETWVEGVVRGIGLAIPMWGGIYSGLPSLLAGVFVTGIVLMSATAAIILVLRRGETDSSICKKCGSLHSPSDRFCSNCGSAI